MEKIRQYYSKICALVILSLCVGMWSGVGASASTEMLQDVVVVEETGSTPTPPPPSDEEPGESEPAEDSTDIVRVCYDANGGSIDPSFAYEEGTVDSGVEIWRELEPLSFEVYYNCCMPATLPNGAMTPPSMATRMELAFVNWNTKKDGTGDTYEIGSVYEGDEDITLYAQYEKEAYASGQNYLEGTWPGYTFQGYYTQEEGGEKVVFPCAVTGETSFYAHWEVDPTATQVPTVISTPIPTSVPGGVVRPGWETESVETPTIETPTQTPSVAMTPTPVQTPSPNVEIQSTAVPSVVPDNIVTNNPKTTEKKESKKDKIAIAKASAPKATSKGKGKVQIKLQKKEKNVSGYEIVYSTSKKFKSKKSVHTKGRNVTLKKLKKGKTYYIKIRAYRKTGKKKVYGKWSKVVKIKVRK